ncbi:MAG: IS110 family transposase [Bacteroidota bacterium]
MKKFSTHVGIDVSKSTLDVCILKAEGMSVVGMSVVPNTQQGIRRVFRELRHLNAYGDDTLFCFENTGVYSVPLCLCLSEAGLPYWEVPALEIKKSKGITRGKTDRTDAQDIARYSVRSLDKFKASSMPEVDIQRMKVLFAERDKTVRALKLFESTTEGAAFLPPSIYKSVESQNRKTIAYLRKALRAIDAKIRGVRERNEPLNAQYNLLRSVPGIGDVTATYMIIATGGFKRFGSWRKFACYSGIAPFQYASGSSIRGKTRVNHLADKKMKSLLNMAALSAVKHDPELKEYYERKKHEGKNPMLVLNNIRCKIVSRAFAVIDRASPYVNLKKFAA